ncbi:hypothetical protein TVAG_394770 [Trichomonas vaginalis G3]|uniref:Uncharacterized protein n=1 Tax=Trichomonas vaginalis (strain ATCC PRA-98 / G3) TaxID=412133 RepID=A2EDE1_TRIV3|nr:hypothetical protein TVAGG3_0725480 [Trichomonas vaginalis G3]EAY09305.1 hypothetical protein TVAG_394770 [Trichomonas vaginalis G3]KAI5510878.1 hypothetical protein TVAGG3_0725480 [Trichomonas vaginalis G3]|eukprot:XP_001321528.1 hypothetical protein [Trichomonas vaginalis G3]
MENKGSCIQYRICSHESFVVRTKDEFNIYLGSHSAIGVSESAENKNYIIESSFNNCRGNGAVLASQNGKIENINISFSSMKYYAGYAIADSLENSFGNTSNFYNITSEVSIFGVGNIKHFISHCNIIKCYDPNNAIIYCIQNSYLSLSQCFIKENTSPLFIRIENTAEIVINHSHYDEDNSIDNTCNNPDMIKIESPQILSKLENKYLSTVFCEAENKYLEEDKLEFNMSCPRMNSKFNIFPLFHVLTSPKNIINSKSPKTMINLNSKINNYKSHLESKLRDKLKLKSKTKCSETI